MSVMTAANTGASGKAGLVLRWTARGILILITVFWVSFCIAYGLGDAQTLGPMGFIMMMPAAVIVLVVLYVAWRWELAGGLLLLAVTVLGAVVFTLNLQRMNLHGMARLGLAVMEACRFILPFLIPAVLLLVKCRLDRTARPTAPAGPRAS